MTKSETGMMELDRSVISYFLTISSLRYTIMYASNIIPDSYSSLRRASINVHRHHKPQPSPLPHTQTYVKVA